MRRVILDIQGLSGLIICCLAMSAHAGDARQELSQSLSAIAHRFDELSFSTPNKRSRRDGFEELLDSAQSLVAANPESVEALTWQGIILSSYAGEVSAFSAMKYANAARASLETAESLDPTALGASIYTSLGALYAQVPGGMIGFGDDERALDYLRKAHAMSPDDLDANYFLADLLIDKHMYAEAREILSHAVAVPQVTERPLLDDARRSAMQRMLEELQG